MNEPGEPLHVAVVGDAATGSGGLGTALDAVTEWATVVAVADVDAVSDDSAVDAVVVADAPPSRDGLADLEQIREADPTLPVFVATESTDPDRVASLLEAGATDVTALGGSEDVARLAARVRTRSASSAGDGRRVAHHWSEVASTLAHDAKNPLNVVVGRLDLMELDPVHEESVNRSVTRVDALLNDLSALGTAGLPVTNPEAVSVGESVERVWKHLETEGASLTVDGDVTVSADPERLRTLLDRLVENALVHGGDGVSVTVEATDTGFVVADDGPGIPPEDRENVLEQGFGTTSDRVGYGLFVAATIADAHGWSIDVGESESGGARLEVRTSPR